MTANEIQGCSLLWRGVRRTAPPLERALYAIEQCSEDRPCENNESRVTFLLEDRPPRRSATVCGKPSDIPGDDAATLTTHATVCASRSVSVKRPRCQRRCALAPAEALLQSFHEALGMPPFESTLATPRLRHTQMQERNRR